MPFNLRVCVLFSGESLECHQCNSGADYDGTACADEFSTSDFLAACPGDANYTVCRKIKQDSECHYHIDVCPFSLVTMNITHVESMHATQMPLILLVFKFTCIFLFEVHAAN